MGGFIEAVVSLGFTAGQKSNKMTYWQRRFRPSPSAVKKAERTKVDTWEAKCKYCGYEALYEFKRCPLNVGKCNNELKAFNDSSNILYHMKFPIKDE